MIGIDRYESDMSICMTDDALSALFGLAVRTATGRPTSIALFGRDDYFYDFTEYNVKGTTLGNTSDEIIAVDPSSRKNANCVMLVHGHSAKFSSMDPGDNYSICRAFSGSDWRSLKRLHDEFGDRKKLYVGVVGVGRRGMQGKITLQICAIEHGLTVQYTMLEVDTRMDEPFKCNKLGFPIIMK